MLLLVAVTVAVETDVKTEVEIDVETEVTAEMDEVAGGIELDDEDDEEDELVIVVEGFEVASSTPAAAIIIITITTTATTVLPIPARLNNFKSFWARTHHIYAFLPRATFNCLANPDSLLGESPGLHSESLAQV